MQIILVCMKNTNTQSVVHIAIGSNLGDRMRWIVEATRTLDGHAAIAIRDVSSLYETAAVGLGDEAPLFLNGALELECGLAPHALMQVLLDVETRLGRVRDGEARTSRTVDLDILLIGDRIINDKRLVVPHPRMRQRRFVLQPLADLAPRQMIPGSGCCVADALEQVMDQPIGKSVAYPNYAETD